MAKQEWARVAPELLRLGLLTVLDRAVLACYCEAYADFLWALEEIREGGRTGVSENGYSYALPAVTIKKQAFEAIRQAAAEFGFTPSARGRMHLPGSHDEDPDDAFLQGPRPAPPLK